MWKKSAFIIALVSFFTALWVTHRMVILKGSGIFPIFLTWTKMTPLLDQVVSHYGSERSEKVKIRNLERTESLLSKLISGGSNSLQLITDFDQTLTRYRMSNGKKCESTYGIIAFSPLVSSKIKEDAMQLYEKYYPIEINVSLSAEEKTPYMIEWYEKSHESFLTSPLKNSQIVEMAKNAETGLRDNSFKLLETLHNSEIPALILSAGMGNLVEEILKMNSVNFPNVKVIANFMKFDDSGVLNGFSDPVVHVYNKNEAALHDINSDYFDGLKNRNNVILMGDSLGDTNMATGVKDANAILKIGFLNTHIVDHLPKYMEAYDVVLTDDQSMDFVNAILQLVIKSK